MDKKTDGWMDKKIDGWMDGWVQKHSVKDDGVMMTTGDYALLCLQCNGEK